VSYWCAVSKQKPYPEVTPQVKFPELEQQVLAYWKERRIFEKSVEGRPAGEDGDNEYIFYDGPPFANGLPHYGHLLTGFVKDIVPRYQTMRGRKVERRFGWDCHGLPAEMSAEKELGVSGRQQILNYGLSKFNDYAKSTVLRYANEWERYVTRQARWVDFKNDYKTMDLSYMESIIWAFKQLWDKGLIYEGFRVMPYSWACETPLSNFEIRMDNATRPRQDPAITVAFNLHPIAGDPGPIRILVWTTTPWTLPSNLALAVGAEIEYSLLAMGETHFVIASAVLKKYEKELKDAKLVGTLLGKDLVDRTYEPLFPYFKDNPRSFRVLAGEFVATEEGTGIVHMAPGFGEDDQKLCQANDIPLVVPVDDQGKFTSEVADYVGQQVFDANKEIIRNLKDRGVLLRHETYMHNYPHCWRTDTPIIYRALNSWYVAVSKIKDRMVELNQQISWIPSHVRDGQFGRGLENAPDWSISRNRFWGSPIPVWRSDNPEYPRTDVYGSLDEIERDFGVRPKDLHRPAIDELVRPNPDDPTGKSMMRRIPEVLDCWFESGSMPFAQVHYPFENKEWFESHFPADFIVEYVAQTRGWFYTLMVLGVALFDKPPFLNCMCHGVVLDEDGQKLSKRLRNYPDPDEVFNTHGADALRWFLMSSAILKGGDLHLDREGKVFAEVVRMVINPLWNVYYFFTLYANSDGIKAEYSTASRELLDRYILCKTRELVETVTVAMDAYDIPEACRLVSGFVDALNNWYVRRSRERFWKHEKDSDKKAAYDTLFTVLHTVCRVVAPLLPMISESIYRGLTSEESIHLANWPEAESLPRDTELVAAMDRIREVCSSGLALRESKNLRTRLPLQAVTIAGQKIAELKPYAALVRDELNVKEVRFAEKVDDFANFILQVHAKIAGPRLGGKVQEAIKASKAGDWRALPDGRIEVAGLVLEKGEFSLGLKPKDGVSALALPSNDAIVVLDTVVTKELEDEGIARDVVRMVQQTRREAALHVSDHISLVVTANDELKSALLKHQQYIAEQTLADSIQFGAPQPGMFSQTGQVAGSDVVVAVIKL
jgi:isoleucyl-tRNA synthetase